LIHHTVPDAAAFHQPHWPHCVSMWNKRGYLWDWGKSRKSL